MMSLVLAVTTASLAQTADPNPADLFSTTAVEIRPDLEGDPRLRIAQRLGIQVPMGDGWRLVGFGGIRGLSMPESAPTLDLWRGVVQYRDGHTQLAIGRLTRVDARGMQRIDGIDLQIAAHDRWQWSAWAGRLWHPEVTAFTDNVLAGSSVRLEGSGQTHGAAGLEARLDRGEFSPRAWAAADWRNLRGDAARALLEVGRGGLRGSATGTWVAGRYLDLGAELRWEDLPVVSAFEVPRSPVAWLAPRGYGVASVRAEVRRGDWSGAASAGPTVRVGNAASTEGEVGQPGVGGRAHAAVTWQLRPGTRLRGFGTAAGIDDAWLAGGGVGITYDDRRLAIDGDLAGWALRALDGSRAPVVEGRMGAMIKVAGRDRGSIQDHVLVGARLAAGADRQLVPFATAGLELNLRSVQRAR